MEDFLISSLYPKFVPLSDTGAVLRNYIQTPFFLSFFLACLLSFQPTRCLGTRSSHQSSDLAVFTSTNIHGKRQAITDQYKAIDRAPSSLHDTPETWPEGPARFVLQETHGAGWARAQGGNRHSPSAWGKEDFGLDFNGYGGLLTGIIPVNGLLFFLCVCVCVRACVRACVCIGVCVRV